MDDILKYITDLKEKLNQRHNIDNITHKNITFQYGDGIKINNSYVFINKFKNGKCRVRIFAPQDQSIERVDASGESYKTL